MACEPKLPITPVTASETPHVTTTSSQAPFPYAASTSTALPIQSHSSVLPDSIELIVINWLGVPSQSEIPTLHLWKDGYAVWVEFEKDDSWHVYQTYLSTTEVAQIRNAITLSQFWQYDGPIIQIPDAILLTIWISETSKERSLSFRYAPKYAELANSVLNVLKGSPTKSEYIPQQAYLFTSRTESYLDNSDKTWSGDYLDLNLETFENGNLVDGATLSALWRTAQHDYFWILSDGNVYDYKLKIPELSCSFDWDSQKYQYLCTPFKVASH